jgi:hypothetical protein
MIYLLTASWKIVGIKFSELSNKLFGCAIEVHRALGPGLLESTYEQCLARELALNGIDFELQVAVPVEYKGLKLDCGYRTDLIVAGEDPAGILDQFQREETDRRAEEPGPLIFSTMKSMKNMKMAE